MAPVLDLFAEALRNWQGFYQITGESAATLTGLMFVTANVGARVFSANTLPIVRTFITPILGHFMTAFVISTLMCVPAPSSTNLTIELGVLSAAGLLILALLLRHMRRWDQHRPVASRYWAWHVALPAASYLCLLGAVGGLWLHKIWAMSVVAHCVLAFIVIGVVNSWEATLRTMAISTEERESMEKAGHAEKEKQAEKNQSTPRFRP